ncbi:MAG: MBOAT family O-acyltransferase [Pseudomonadota bacterium]
MNGDANFGIIADFIVLTPLLLALRAAFPRAVTVQASFFAFGAYAMYSVAPRFLLFYFSYWAIIGVLQWGMSFAAKKSAPANISKIATTLMLMLALSPLVIWKVWPEPFVSWVTATFARLLWVQAPSFAPLDAIAPLVAPIGLSFAVFRALDLLIKIRLELLKPLSPLKLGYYAFFAPVLAVGPVIEFEEIALKDKLSRFPASGDIAVGVFRVAIGVAKIMVLAYGLSYLANTLWQGGAAGWLATWGALFLYGFYFYINFSGYSDLAIGVSRLHGMRLKENFDNPFLKTNPQAFWASWHMSLTRWCQRYVFIPLGGMRASRQYFATFGTIMIIALWHGISVNMVIFGVYHAVFLLGHRYLENRRIAEKRRLSKARSIKMLKSFGIFAYVAISIPLFSLPLTSVASFYARLIPGMEGGL